VRLRGADIAQLINLGSTWSLPGLPRLMDQISRADYRGLQQVAQQRYSVGDYAWGMRYSVWCQEEAPFARPARVRQQARLSPALAGWPTAVVADPVRRAWQLPPASNRVNTPVVGSVPTLIICGEYDAETPVAWGRLAAKTLSKGYVVEMRGLSHVPTQFWDNSCGMDLAQGFFTNPGQSPSIPCLAQLKAPRFTTKVQP
jgi:pimeloyl-ACP methyl ester carboxylesterase